MAILKLIRLVLTASLLSGSALTAAQAWSSPTLIAIAQATPAALPEFTTDDGSDLAIKNITAGSLRVPRFFEVPLKKFEHFPRPDLPNTVTAKFVYSPQRRHATGQLLSIDGLAKAPLPITLYQEIDRGTVMILRSKAHISPPAEIALPNGQELDLVQVTLSLNLDGSDGKYIRLDLGNGQEVVEYHYQEHWLETQNATAVS